MRTRVQKWGNSLGLCIPKVFAREARLEHDSAVEITLVDGKIMVEPVVEPGPTLEQLLADITEQNLHGEYDTGPAVGKETW